MESHSFCTQIGHHRKRCALFTDASGLQRPPLDPGRMDTTATKQQYLVEGALRPGGSLHYVGTRMVPASYPGTMRQHVRGRVCAHGDKQSPCRYATAARTLLWVREM